MPQTESKTNWKFDNFYPDADSMRQKIHDHFYEKTAKSLPFNKRAVWNYWFIPTLYAYFRADPISIFDHLFEEFMTHLRAFAARQFGMVIPTKPFLSMYINGCGQNIHNDATNGRLAYVYSLTNWKDRHFTGGETFVYKTGDKQYEKIFMPTGGWGFYDFIEPEFNRLALFDDRMPHAVNFIQGTMNPLDARFVIHGHMEESKTIPYAEGGLSGADLSTQWEQMKNPISKIFQSHGCKGFITVELSVSPAGNVDKTEITCMQLLPFSGGSNDPSLCIDDAMPLLEKSVWPVSEKSSKLIFALGSEPLRP